MSILQPYHFIARDTKTQLYLVAEDIEMAIQLVKHVTNYSNELVTTKKLGRNWVLFENPLMFGGDLYERLKSQTHRGYIDMVNGEVFVPYVTREEKLKSLLS